MISRKARPRTITEYIKGAPKEVREKLREMCACIRAAAPGAKESLKWGMPAFSYQRILVTFALNSATFLVASDHPTNCKPTCRSWSAFAEMNFSRS